MRVLIIGNVEFDTDNAAALRVFEVVCALRREGHVVDVSNGRQLSKQSGGQPISQFASVCPPDLVTGRLHRALAKVGLGFSLLYTSGIAAKYDVIYCYGSALSWLIGGWLVARTSGARLVADVTELYGFEDMTRSFSHFRSRIGGWIGLFVALPLLAKKVAVPTRYFGRIVRRCNRQVVLLPPFFGPLAEPEASGDSRELSLAYAGTPSNKEEMQLLLRTLWEMREELTRPLRLVLVGIDEKQVERWLSNGGSSQVREHPWLRIEARGRTDVRTARRIVAASDFLIVIRAPSLRVNCGFPSKVAEAYCLGTPVIANLYSDIAHYVQDGENGFVIPRDSAEAIRNLVHRCLNLDPDVKARIRKRARETGRVHFSSDAVLYRLNTLIS